MNPRIVIKFFELLSLVNKELYLKPKIAKRRDFPLPVKQIVLGIQQNRCNWCSNFLKYPVFDHIDGNRINNDISNCQALCPNCHAEKTRNL